MLRGHTCYGHNSSPSSEDRIIREEVVNRDVKRMSLHAQQHHAQWIQSAGERSKYAYWQITWLHPFSTNPVFQISENQKKKTSNPGRNSTVASVDSRCVPARRRSQHHGIGCWALILWKFHCDLWMDSIYIYIIYLELREGQNFCPDGKGQKFVSFQNKNVIARNKCRFMLLPSHAPTVSFCSISIWANGFMMFYDTNIIG